MGTDVTQLGPLDDLDPDAAVLIAGPPMTGKYQLLLRLLGAKTDAAILISTKNGVERVRDDYRAVTGTLDEARLGVVDCISYHEAPTVTGPVRFVGSPENLTRIGVKFTDLFEGFREDPDVERLGVGLHSVSQLLMHSKVNQVYQFLQVLVGQIRNERCLVVAVVDTSAADDEVVRTLQQHFDGLVTTRENETGTREYRVRGLSPSASPWTEF